MSGVDSLESVSHIQKLKDVDSYAMWDFEVKILFRAKELMDVVDGSDSLKTVEADESKIKKWKSKDAKAQHFILMTIDQQVKPHILTCSSSKEMYDTLKRIYERESSQQKCLLLQELYNFKFDSEKDMMTNICHIQNIAFKLNRLNQPVDDTMIITKILTVLPEQYRHFSSAWDSTSASDRTIDNLKARLVQEESKLKTTDSDGGNVAFKVMNQNKGRPRDVRCYNCKERGHIQTNCPNKKFCQICKKSNHYEKDCFLKNKGLSKKQCTICKKSNHVEKDCFFRDKDKCKSKNSNKTVFLTQSHETHVLVGLTVNGTSRCNKSFVIDSGCTPSHMTNDLSILDDVKECKQNIVVAKKDQSMCAVGVGSVKSNECI